MTKRESDNIQVPDRAHDQPVEGGREQADEAVERSSATGRPSPAEESPARGPDGIDSTTEGLEERMPRGVEPPV
jgi:hypothetical protein